MQLFPEGNVDKCSKDAISALHKLELAHSGFREKLRSIYDTGKPEFIMDMTPDGLWKMGYDRRNAYMITGYQQLSASLVDFRIVFFEGYQPVKIINPLKSRLYVIKGEIENLGNTYVPGGLPLEAEAYGTLRLNPIKFPTVTISVVSLDGSEFDDIKINEKVLDTAI